MVQRAWSHVFATLCAGLATLGGLAAGQDDPPVVVVPAAEPSNSEMLDQRDLGLTGRKMVPATARRAAAPSGAFMANGTAPIGMLSAKHANTEEVLGLRDLTVNAELEGVCARTTVTHVFANETKDTLEGVFTFALPPGAAVDRFAMTIQSESDLMEASLVERTYARNVYRELVYGRSIDPGLLEWVDQSTFRATIFPIPAHGTKTIVVSYLTPLKQTIGTDGRRFVQFNYPLYGQGEGKAVLPPATKVKLVATLPNLPFGAELHSSLEMKAGANERGVLQFTAEFPGARAPEEHWLLELEMPAARKGTSPECLAQAHRVAGQPGTFAITLTPQTGRPNMPEALDVLFMLDTSANRTGAEFAGSLELLEAALKNLRPADRFAVVAFDLKARTFRQAWSDAAPEQIEKAVQFLRARSPLGATDIAGAFEMAEKTFAASAVHPVSVVYVGDTQATFGAREPEQVRKAVDHAMEALKGQLLTIYPGMGTTSNAKTAFEAMKGLAELCGSPVLQLTPDVRPAVLGEGLARNAGLPIIRYAKVKVELPDGTELTDLAPGIMGGLPGNASSTFYGRYEKGGEATVTLTGTLDGVKYLRAWKVTLPAVEPSNIPVEKLWARARVEQLEANGQAAEANRIATEAQILSHGTAFLVLDSEDTFNRYGIKRETREAVRRLAVASRFVGARQEGAQRQVTEESGQDKQAEPREVRAFTGTVQIVTEPIEIDGVFVNVSMSGAGVPARQPGRTVPLSPQDCTERRFGLTRLIADKRGLPFEPETVLPALWITGLSRSHEEGKQLLAQFGPCADEELWSQVQSQPLHGKDEWKQPNAGVRTGGAGGGLSAGKQNISPVLPLIEAMISPRQPSSIKLAGDAQSVQLVSHQAAHQLLASILYGQDTQQCKGGGESEVLRAINTIRSVAYDLRRVPAERLAAAYTFLAELSLVEKQYANAADFAARAIQLAPAASGDLASEPRRACLLLGLAQQLSGDFVSAAASYRKMLTGLKPFRRYGMDLTYVSLVNAMSMGGDKEGALKVMERWCAQSEDKLAIIDQIGRGYLSLNRAEDAARAFSSKAEFDPKEAENRKRPEDFLPQ